MVQTVSPANIEAQIQGEISGQVVVGNHNVQIHAEHGAVVNFVSDENRPVPRPRPAPVLFLRPRRFPGLLDRKIETDAATSAFLDGTPVEVYGEAGVGKTALLRHLAYHADAGGFQDGVIYRSAVRQPLDDLFQFLFDAFYECEVPFKPTDTQVRYFLQDKRALVLLDDIALAREEVESLIDAAPGCVFACAERRLWGEVRAIALRGLPKDDAVALLERELGRTLTSEESASAQALYDTLDGHPLRILQQAAIAREERRTLLEITQLAPTALRSEELTGQVLASLDETQRSLLATLAAVGGAPVHAEHIAALSGLPNVEPVLQTLQDRKLVQVDQSRYRLSGDLSQFLEQAWDLTAWKEHSLTYFTTRLQASHRPLRIRAPSTARPSR